MIDKDFSKAVSALRAPMCLLVVFIHTSVIKDSSAQVVATKVLDITSMAVPFFFLVAGYFYFAKVGNKFTVEFYRRQSQKRMWSLLLPYMLWTMIALIFTLASMKIYFHGGSCDNLYKILSTNDLMGRG